MKNTAVINRYHFLYHHQHAHNFQNSWCKFKGNKLKINCLKSTMTQPEAENAVANGVPMTTPQMCEYLQGYFGSPVVLRNKKQQVSHAHTV